MSLKNLLFVTIAFVFIQTTSAQRNFDQSNHIGLSGGISLSDIQTDNFTTEQGGGYYLSFNTRGAFWNDFDLIYGIGFLQSEIGILGSDVNSTNGNFDEQYIDYEMTGAQIKMLLSYNIIVNHLSVEAGPLLNVNGKLKLKRSGFEDFVLDGYETLRAEDIQNVSRIHARVAAGVTAGITNFRLGVQYQYGLTNQFNRFNDNPDLEQSSAGDFKGNTSNILFTAAFYF